MIIKSYKDIRNELISISNENAIENENSAENTIEVHPIIVRKTPKFPSRERNLAIRRKKIFPEQIITYE